MIIECWPNNCDANSKIDYRNIIYLLEFIKYLNIEIKLYFDILI